MRDAVLAIVGTIGIAALVMSMNKEKKQVAEKCDFTEKKVEEQQVTTK